MLIISTRANCPIIDLEFQEPVKEMNGGALIEVDLERLITIRNMMTKTIDAIQGPVAAALSRSPNNAGQIAAQPAMTEHQKLQHAMKMLKAVWHQWAKDVTTEPQDSETYKINTDWNAFLRFHNMSTYEI